MKFNVYVRIVIRPQNQLGQKGSEFEFRRDKQRRYTKYTKTNFQVHIPSRLFYDPLSLSIVHAVSIDCSKLLPRFFAIPLKRHGSRNSPAARSEKISKVLPYFVSIPVESKYLLPIHIYTGRYFAWREKIVRPSKCERGSFFHR